MTAGAGPGRSLEPVATDPRRPRRNLALGASLVLFLACLVPPILTEARRYEFVQAAQYCLLLAVVPALAVVGAPWRLLHLASSDAVTEADGEADRPPIDRPIDRLARSRRRHPELVRAACFLAVYLAAAIVWRTPWAVDGMRHRPWLVVLEAVTLVPAGIGLWLELVESPPLVPRLARPHRVALAAVSMWTVWILAYLVGLSHASWYHAYPHHPGSGFSVSADQQLTTGVMLVLSGVCYVPVVYWNLIRWLQSEEDPDEELHRLIRQERIRGRTVEGGSSSR